MLIHKNTYVCAVLNSDTKEIFAKLEKHIEDVGNVAEGSEAKSLIEAVYKRHKDVPVMIASTENGWQSLNLNRRINPGHATILVTTKNARPTLKQDIIILDRPKNNGKIIEWR